MLRRSVATFLVFTALSTAAFAQFYPTRYRPPNQHWQFLKTPHFKLVYAKGNDSTALEMGRILEEEYQSVQHLVGGELNNFPVVLNDYNDRSNGFVTPIHFRSEIELPPIKGKALNPQTGNWLENVGPHELVHALQLSNLGDFNLPRFVNLFSPDLARAFHGAIPFGMLEGVAVYHETASITPNGGRGNYPYFTNQFDATFNSGRRWSMGQLFQTSTYTRPLNRHYIGGYEFTNWLQNEFGHQTTREALDFYMDFPILGYGVALRHATGSWPSQLYDQFEEDQQQRLVNQKQYDKQSSLLSLPFKGSEIRRPKWLSDSTLVFYGSFYNARPGFYTYDLKNGRLNRIITTNSVSDYRYDLSENRSSMIFSYYESSPFYDNTAKAELVRYDFKNAQKQQLTDNGRLYAPSFTQNGLLALKIKNASSQLVSVSANGEQSPTIEPIASPENMVIKAVAVNPMNQKLAVVANKQGTQALWITTREELSDDLQEAPKIAFDKGSVFDPAWHPNGQKILFSSDFSGVLQIYEFDLPQEEVRQLSRTDYNAFEGSYNSEGTRIAFIRQHENKRLPAVLDQSDFLNKKIPGELWRPDGSTLSSPYSGMVISDSIKHQSAKWQAGDYTAGISWLKPRAIFPIFEEVSNREVYRAGLRMESNNLLASQSYSAELSYVENRGWYEFTYLNKSFYPGFKSSFYSRPAYISVPIQNNTASYTLLRQERSLALSIPLRLQLNQNIFSSSLLIEPEIRHSQFRYFDIRESNASSTFANISIASLYAQFNYRLQQNIRDLQPNTGLALYAELEHYLSSGTAELNSSNRSFRLSFQRPSALRGGLITFLSPLRRWNQSLRLEVSGITQSGPIFDNQSLVSNAFSGPVMPTAANLLSLESRYTIPITYIDEGGFLFPLYLENLYLVAFSNTITNPTASNWYNRSRSVFGIGIRSKFRLSNLSFDIGIGFGYEPSRKNHRFIIGDF